MRILAALLFALPLFAQSPCETPAHHALDFWIGEWDVTNAAGKPAGHSVIERALDNCVVIEHWRGARGGNGVSFNRFDPASKQWQQHWVDNGGSSLEMTGGPSGEQFIYNYQSADQSLGRMTFTHPDANHVRQHIEQSKDGGKSWATQYDLQYARVAQRP